MSAVPDLSALGASYLPDEALPALIPLEPEPDLAAAPPDPATPVATEPAAPDPDDLPIGANPDPDPPLLDAPPAHEYRLYFSDGSIVVEAGSPAGAVAKRGRFELPYQVSDLTILGAWRSRVAVRAAAAIVARAPTWDPETPVRSSQRWWSRHHR